MNWLLISLIGPFLWSISNHLDKILLHKHLKGIGKEALVLYSTLFGVLVLPLALLFDQTIFKIGLFNISLLVFAGFISSIGIYLYLCALEKDEASLVIPFFQIIPVLGFILGYLFLGELLTKPEIIACLVIVAGATIVSLEINEVKKIKFKRGLFFLMLSSSFYYALYETLFKLGTNIESFWVSTFWQYMGLLIFGIIVFLSSRKYRTDFTYLIRIHNWKLLSINAVNESITILGNTAYNFALLLAPVAMVMTVNGYQPIFVFLEGVILTILFPKLVSEKLSRVHLFHKISAIIIVFIGTYMLYNA